jgi:hypothetical protein
MSFLLERDWKSGKEPLFQLFCNPGAHPLGRTRRHVGLTIAGTHPGCRNTLSGFADKDIALQDSLYGVKVPRYWKEGKGKEGNP